MKGSYFLGAGSTPKFEVRDMEFAPLAPTEVKVQVMSCGICGTDVHIYQGEEGSAAVTPPVVLGHEFAGVVAETGSAVTSVCVGDHVTVDPNIYCGQCTPCRTGKKQNCEHLSAIGVNRDGGFAQYCVCPEAQCFKLNKDVDFDAAAMAEPLACILHGLDQAGIQTGDVVCVIGGGAIGQIMVQLARLSGASQVILSEPVEMRRKIGLDVGADAVINPTAQDISTEIQKISGKSGADVVIECVGKESAAKHAFEAAGLGATILFFSVPSVHATVSLPLFQVFKKELKIVGSIINPDTHLRAVSMINSGRLKLKELITHTYRIDQLEEAIKMQMFAESIKVCVHPQEH